MGELKYLELHGDRIAYRDAGSGETLLLIHGMAGKFGDLAGGDPTAVAKKYRVVAPDLLGHGQSDKPRGDYSLGAFAVWLRDSARRAGYLACDDRRPIAWWRRGHAVRLPTSGLLPAADPHQQRWAGSRCRLDAATAVGPRRRADPAGHRAATGSDRRQQAALVVRSGRNSVTPRCGDVERLLIAVGLARPARPSCGRCDRWSTTAVRP